MSRTHSGHDDELDERLAAAFAADRRRLEQDANLPSPAIVWFRAQAQARRAALERASQPITVVHGIAAACAGGLTATAAGLYVPTFRRAIESLTGWTATLSGFSLPPEPLSSPVVIAVVLAASICTIFTPLALYFTLRED